MAANVERSILLRLVSEVKIENIKDAIDLLGKLEQQVMRLRNLTRTPIDISPAAGNAVKAAEQGIASVTNGLRNQISVQRSLNESQIEGARNARTALIQQFDAQGRLKRQQEEIFAKGQFGSGATASQTIVGGNVRRQKTVLSDDEIQRDGRLRERAIKEDQALEDRRIRESMARLDLERVQRARIQKAIAEDEARRQRDLIATQALEDRRIKENISRVERERLARAAILAKMQADENAVTKQREAEARAAEAHRQRQLNVIDRAQRPGTLEEQRRQNATQTFAQLATAPGAVVTEGQALNRTTGQLERVLQLTNAQTGANFQLNTATKQLTGSYSDMTQAIAKGGDTLQNAAGKVLLWSVATGAIFGTLRALRAGIDTFSDYESATISLARVGRGFGSSQDEIVDGARRVSEEILNLKVQFGSTGDEAQEAAVIFARLGLSQQQVIDGVRTALLASNVAGIGAAEAAGLLAATMQQFKLNVSDLPDLLNKLNTLENTNKVTTNDLLQAIGRAGAVVRESGASLEEFAAIVAVVSQATGRTGAEIGNAYKTIASRIADTTVQAKVFESTGIGIRNIQGELKPLGELLGELVVKFQSLSAAEKAELTTQIAGIRQRNILQTTLDNYFQVQAQVIRQLKETSDAESENALVVETLEKKVAQLKASFERLAVAFLNSGLADIIKAIADAIIAMLDSINRMGTAGQAMIALFAAWVAAVITLTVAQTTLGAAFVSSFTQIAASAGRVNAAIGSFIGMQTAQQAVSARTIASNEALAASYANVNASSNLRVFDRRGIVEGAAKASLFSRAGLASAAGALALPAAAVAGVGLGASVGISQASENIRSTRPFEEGNESQRALDVAARRVKRAQNDVKAFEEQVQLATTAVAALREIEAAEASGQADGNEAQRTRLEIGKALVSAIGLEGEAQDRAIEGTLRAVDAADALAQAKLNLTQATRGLQVDLQAELSKQLEEAGKLRREIEENKRFIKDAEGSIFTLRGTFFTAGPKSTLREQQRDLQEMDKRIDETLRKMEESKDQEAFTQAFITVEALEKELSRLSQLMDERFELELEFEPDKVARANLELEKQRKLVAAIKESAEFKNATTDASTSKEAREKLQKEVEKQRDLEIKARISAANKSYEADKRSFDARYKLAQDLAQRQAGLATTESRRPIAEKEAEIQLDLKALEILKERKQVLDQELARSRSGAAFGDFRQGVTTLTEAEFSAKNNELRAAKERIDEIEMGLEGKAADLIITRLDTERKITQERIQQQEELRKQLSQMSDMDLIQTRIFAARLRRGENRSLSEGEFLALPENQRKFLQQQQEFFPGANIVPKIDLQLDERFFSKLEEAPKLSAEEHALFDRLKDFDPFKRGSVVQLLPPADGRDGPPELLRRNPLQDPGAERLRGDAFSSGSAITALDLTVNLAGVDVPVSQLAHQIGLEVRALVQEVIDENVNRAKSTAKRPLHTSARSAP